MVGEAFTRQELIDHLLSSDSVISAVLSLKYTERVTVNGVSYEQIQVNALWDTGGNFYAGSPFKTLSTEVVGSGTTLKGAGDFDPVMVIFEFYPDEENEKQIMGDVTFEIVDKDRARVKVRVVCSVSSNNFKAIKKALSDNSLPIKRMEIGYDNIRPVYPESVNDFVADVQRFDFGSGWTVDPLEYEHLMCPVWWSK